MRTNSQFLLLIPAQYVKQLSLRHVSKINLNYLWLEVIYYALILLSVAVLPASHSKLCQRHPCVFYRLSQVMLQRQ